MTEAAVGKDAPGPPSKGRSGPNETVFIKEVQKKDQQQGGLFGNGQGVPAAPRGENGLFGQNEAVFPMAFSEEKPAAALPFPQMTKAAAGKDAPGPPPKGRFGPNEADFPKDFS